jgi:hypothetical protein
MVGSGLNPGMIGFWKVTSAIAAQFFDCDRKIERIARRKGFGNAVDLKASAI